MRRGRIKERGLSLEMIGINIKGRGETTKWRGREIILGPIGVTRKGASWMERRW